MCPGRISLWKIMAHNASEWIKMRFHSIFVISAEDIDATVKNWSLENHELFKNYMNSLLSLISTSLNFIRRWGSFPPYLKEATTLKGLRRNGFMSRGLFKRSFFDWQLATSACSSHLSKPCCSSLNSFAQTSSEQLEQKTWDGIPSRK